MVTLTEFNKKEVSVFHSRARTVYL